MFFFFVGVARPKTLNVFIPLFRFFHFSKRMWKVIINHLQERIVNLVLILNKEQAVVELKKGTFVIFIVLYTMGPFRHFLKTCKKVIWSGSANVP